MCSIKDITLYLCIDYKYKLEEAVEELNLQYEDRKYLYGLAFMLFNSEGVEKLTDATNQIYYGAIDDYPILALLQSDGILFRI